MRRKLYLVKLVICRICKFFASRFLVIPKGEENIDIHNERLVTLFSAHHVQTSISI
jgi:hypothetical protein